MKHFIKLLSVFSGETSSEAQNQNGSSNKRYHTAAQIFKLSGVVQEFNKAMFTLYLIDFRSDTM